MKKLMITGLASTALILAANIAPAFAATTGNLNQTSKTSQQSSQTFQSTTVTSPKAISKSQLAYLQKNAVVDTNPTEAARPLGLVMSPQTVSPNFNYSGVYPGSYIDTIAHYTITSTETVSVNAVQYYPGLGFSTPVVDYQLIPVGSSGSPSSVQQVTGSFTSSDAWIYFSNVQPGTYYLEISNLGQSDLSGNGYVHY